MQRFTCECGNVLFFGNSQCLKCSSDVGYDPGASRMVQLRDHPELVLCANGVTHGVCNWLTDNDGSPAPLCVACRTNRTIPDLSFPQNVTLWGRVEMAKRQLLHAASPWVDDAVKTRRSESGLAFDLVSTSADPKVTMGHLDGVITVTLEEADDAYRQLNRQRLGEEDRPDAARPLSPRNRALFLAPVGVGKGPRARRRGWRSMRCLATRRAITVTR